MRNVLCLLPLLILFSCGKVEPLESETPDGTGGGEWVTVEPLGADDSARISTICEALDAKLLSLPEVGDRVFTFAYAEKSCTQATLGQPSDIQVKIRNEYDDFFFNKLNGERFAFPQVETTSYGIMAEICRKRPLQQNSITLTSTTAIRFTTFPRLADCAADGEESICIKLEKGRLDQGTKYNIISTEWIKFKVKGELTGYFTERRLVTSQLCPAGKVFSRRATLK